MTASLAIVVRMRCVPRAAFGILSFILATAASAALVELTGAVQLSEGGAHRCVVTTAGGVKCWGDNTYGQLGDGSFGNSRFSAGDVLGLTSGVSSVATGAFHTCALMASGGVKCWGANFAGELGEGSANTRSVSPVDVIGLGGAAVQISAGGNSTCAVLTGGSLECWGSNVEGQLGDGTTVARSFPVAVSNLPAPVAQVSITHGHTCAVTTGGAALCWGANYVGQLGDGTTTNRLTPVPVASLASGVAAVRVAGGDSRGLFAAYMQPAGHSCAVMSSGGAKCWGANGNGQVGDGTQSNRLTPFDVQGLTSGVANVSPGYGIAPSTRGSAGASGFTCAATNTGAVKCWGVTWGLRGFGCTAFTTCDSTAVTAPADIAGLGNGAISASSGNGYRGFNCALMSDTRVKCWGDMPARQEIPTVVLTGTLAQTITFGPAPTVDIGGSGTLSATASSGLSVAFASLTPGICSVSGSTVSGLASGLCTVSADQAGNAYYEPAPQVTQTFRVGPPRQQTITFGPAPSVMVSGVGNLNATASSGLPVSFVSNTPSICSVSGRVVTGVAAGSCTVTASQGGDMLYAPAPQVTQTFPVAANDGSTFGLVVTRAGSGSGTVTSSPPGIDCGTSCGANYAAGTSVMLAAAAAANSVFGGWSGACTGTGSCLVTMSALREVTATFSPATTIPRLANIATRMQVLTGDNVLIGGFIIGGSAPKTVVIRARGPSLAQHGLTGLLANPKLDLYSGQTLIGSNDDWQGASNASALTASGFAPSQAVESAILVTLDPGAYTAIVRGSDGGTGIGIVEVFEVDRADVPLVNIATRGQVLTGNDVMIGGFIIQGSEAQTVVVRARGPSLAPQGITAPLADPVLELYSGSSVIASNDNWATAANADQLWASGFAPADSRESAILITLQPGPYTAIVRGVNGATGIGIVEVFAR